MPGYRQLTLAAGSGFPLAAQSGKDAPELEPAVLRASALKAVQPLPERMPGAENDTPALVQLGKDLYFEKRLSQNNSQSCNSCHLIENGKGGVDNQPTSPGAFGKRGGRNSPTTLNACFQMAQFGDGRAAMLADPAKGPVLNPIEMGMPTAAEMVKRLRADKRYQEAFKAAFPGQANPISYQHMASLSDVGGWRSESPSSRQRHCTLGRDAGIGRKCTQDRSRAKGSVREFA